MKRSSFSVILFCVEFFFQRYRKMFEANNPETGGSPYLQKKVEAAKKILEEQIQSGKTKH